jgi:uncharacterized membrane protein
MKRLTRLWRHLTTTSAAGQRLFPPAALKRIEQAVAAGEARHRAEVRLIVEPALDLASVWRGVGARQRARALFAHYGVWNTEENCGVLVYVNLADRQVEIVADRGVGRAVSAAEWHRICRTMTQGFAHGDFQDSVIGALDELSALLAQHYPDDGGTRNQLPDRPIVL